ncbi:MAG: FtsH protease activity modulator HflK [Alphaproteobacteria bacterium]|nr:FtsH protease activity modulator HflK [Alphaproteobacteria bacterium]
MSWKNQGGPWGGGGGGGNGGGSDPWSGGRGGRGGSGMEPPDLEDLLRRGQDKFRRVLPGGFGGGRVVGLAVLAGIALWLSSGFYRVQPGEQGVELLFGKYLRVTTPGLNYWLPRPIGAVLTPNVERTNQINIGFRSAGDMSAAAVRDVPLESLMLTGDQNIIDIDFIVQWRVKNAADFLFKIRDPESTVKLAAESAMREIVGRTPLEDALTIKRQDMEAKTKDLLQHILDEYSAGVFIADVKLQKVDPPAQVIDAFNDVQRARQDKERKQNEAQAYANDILPRAKGEAQRMVQEATAYKERLIREAEGEANRFISVHNAYLQDKDVTRKRLYLERMQQILKDSEKVIIDKGNAGVVPYLPLPELRRRGGETAPARSPAAEGAPK